MSVRIVNKMGVISVENDIIVDAAALAVKESYGILGIALKSGKRSRAILLDANNAYRGISLGVNNNTLNFDIHVIVEYGSNIQAVGDSAAQAVKDKVSDIVGVKVGSVNIFVEGIGIG